MPLAGNATGASLSLIGKKTVLDEEFYQDTAFTLSATNWGTSTVTVKIHRLRDDITFYMLGTLVTTTGNVTQVVADNTLPERFRPNAENGWPINHHIRTLNGTSPTGESGLFSVDHDGNIGINRSSDTTLNFTAGSFRGWSAFTATWSRDKTNA